MATPIHAANSINSILKQMDSAGASPRVVSAIQQAASTTGVDFSYLMQKASQESSFDPTAKATTSSATGLYQFTNQTWLQMVKNHGEAYGLGAYASKIQESASGAMTVADASTRRAILALRNDPRISAVMAGELAKENAAVLKNNVGGSIGGTELYLAHFLGAGGASTFLQTMRSNPGASAADLLPAAAQANRGVFYTASGKERSVGEVYQRFAKKFDGTSGSTQFAARQQMPTGNSGVSSAGMAVAQLLPVSTAATVDTSGDVSTEAYGRFRDTTTSRMASSTTVASLWGSSLFDAMVFGQIQDAQLNQTAATAAFNRRSGEGRQQGNSAWSSLA